MRCEPIMSPNIIKLLTGNVSLKCYELLKEIVDFIQSAIKLREVIVSHSFDKLLGENVSPIRFKSLWEIANLSSNNFHKKIVSLSAIKLLKIGAEVVKWIN